MPLPRPRLAVVASLLAACGTTHAPATVPVAPAAPVAAVAATSARPARTTATAASPPAPLKIRSVEGIDEYVLGNGMSVLVFPDSSQSTVTVNITYFVGSKSEGYGETGMAHLLEHMMFKGSPDHRNVLKLLDERGAFANGSTWNDRTNYYETLPAQGDNLTWAIDLEADRMLHASISKEDLSTEFSVVRNELEMGENDPVGVLEERVVSTAYLWHNYGKSAIGSRSDVENVPTDRLRTFYEKYYQPDNAMLVIAGKFDVDAALAEVNRTFGAMPRPTRTLPASYTVEPVQDGERSVVLRRTGDVHVLLALYHAVASADPDHVAFDAIEYLLTDEPTGRLYQRLVASGVASDVWGVHHLFHDPHYLAIGVKAKDDKATAKARDVLLAALEGFAKDPVKPEEVERFKAAKLKELTMLTSDSSRLAVELSEWAAAGDWRLLFVYRDRVAALTAADVQRVATSYLKPSNRTLGEFVPTAAPDRAPAPATPDVAAAVDQIAGTGAEAGEDFVASLDNLAKRVHVRELAGGLHAAFLPKKTRGGKVVVTLTLRHGDEKSLAGKGEIARLTAALAERGTTSHSFAALSGELDKLTADVSIDGGPGEVSVRITTVRASLPRVIDLVAEMLEHPALAPKELEVVRREEIASAEESRQEPDQLAATRFARAIAPWPRGDVRYAETPDERIAALQKVTLADVRAYHKQFWGTGDGEVVAVGDFDADVLARQLETDLAGWTRKAGYARIVNKTFSAKPVDEQIDTRDKEMAIIIGGHDLALADDNPDVPALTIAAQIFGGNTGSRLWMRLREKEGFSYSVWGYIEPGELDPAGSMGFGAQVAPQNLSKAKAALLDELHKLIDQGVTDAEVATAIKAWTDQQDNLLADDEVLAGILGNDRYLGRDIQYHADLRARIAKVTAADVNRALKAWVAPDRLLVISAGDLAKAK